MARTYEEDLRVFWRNQLELQKREILLEIIKLAAENATYEGFRAALYAQALAWMEEGEKEGLVKPNATKQAEEKLADEGILQ